VKLKRIAAACDGGVGHCSKTTTRQKKIVGPVDATVKTIYSPPHSRFRPHRFQPYRRQQEPS
jgi:hypothetical protein